MRIVLRSPATRATPAVGRREQAWGFAIVVERLLVLDVAQRTQRVGGEKLLLDPARDLLPRATITLPRRPVPCEGRRQLVHGRRLSLAEAIRPPLPSRPIDQHAWRRVAGEPARDLVGVATLLLGSRRTTAAERTQVVASFYAGDVD